MSPADLLNSLDYADDTSRLRRRLLRESDPGVSGFVDVGYLNGECLSVLIVGGQAATLDASVRNRVSLRTHQRTR
jgi:hypothetical protein